MSRPLIGKASLAQHGMWLTERAGAGGTAHHMPLAVRLDGPLDVEAMLAACAAVAERHPVLRAALVERGGEPSLVRAADPPPIVVEEARAGFVEREVARPFDLSAGPPARFTLFRLAPERHVLLVVAHHVVFDGVSKDVLLDDLSAAYGGAALDPPAVPYGRVVEDGLSRVAAKQEAAAEFWRTRRREDPDLRLPGLRARPSLRAAPGLEVDLPVPEGFAAAAGQLGVTRFELLLTVLHTLLYGYGNDAPVVAVDLSTRAPESRDHVGLFVNELPVACAPGGETTFAEFAASVRAELRAVYAFREVPLARALGGVSPRTALAPVSLSYRRRDGGDPVFHGLDASVDWAMFSGAVRNPLHLQVVDAPDRITATVRFDPEAVDGDVVAGHLRTLLAAVAERPGDRLAELPLPAAVRAPEAADAGPRPAGGPADESLVKEVTAIWQEALDRDRVDPDDDLFDLGGHSLTITRIIAMVRERLDVELSFEVFIDLPTVNGVAEEIARTREETC
ncbi:condensation domain-containing protein [Streptosporangium sp. NPDC048047]|uniref:condensation domain-containing protein n=1 Tax=Streptosporangium sp. NPDC048047 TaxID=3155748 RepID=UPI003416D5BE